VARIRSIKPEYWADQDLAEQVSRDARLLYIGLWNLADEHGRLRGDPRYIKDAYWRVSGVLDRALGTEEEDGAGEGLASDVALLAQRYADLRARVLAPGTGTGWAQVVAEIEAAELRIPGEA
jgi:hypothetical protein